MPLILVFIVDEDLQHKSQIVQIFSTMKSNAAIYSYSQQAP